MIARLGCQTEGRVKSLPNDKIVNWSKLKAFTVHRVQKFQNSYLSSCHFALIIQLFKEGKSTCPDQLFPSKDERTSGFFGL